MKKSSSFDYKVKRNIEIIPFFKSFNSFSSSDFWKFASSFDSNFFIIKFFATWCFPCKKIDKTLSLVEIMNKTVLIKIDVDKMPSVAKSSVFNIKTIPTLFIFKNGELILRLENSSITKEELERVLTI